MKTKSNLFSPILPPTCTMGQFLRLFCAKPAPDTAPALLGPWVGAGRAGDKVAAVTAASDGDTACVWIAGRDRSFPEWASLSPLGSTTASPLTTFRPLYRAGARHPLGLLGDWGSRRDQTERVSVRWTYGVPHSLIDILGSLAHIDPRWVYALSHCDSCFFGLSNAKPVNGLHHSVSVRAGLAGKIIQGVIICAAPPQPKPVTNNR